MLFFFLNKKTGLVGFKANAYLLSGCIVGWWIEKVIENVLSVWWAELTAQSRMWYDVCRYCYKM